MLSETTNANGVLKTIDQRAPVIGTPVDLEDEARRLRKQR
jgi:hypothetical protein